MLHSEKGASDVSRSVETASAVANANAPLPLSTATCGHSVFERTSEGEGILRSASPPLSPMLPPMMRLPHDCDGDGDAELEMEGRERDPQSER